MPTQEQVQQIIDTVFAWVESKEGPIARGFTVAAQKAIDANIATIYALIVSKLGGGPPAAA